MTSGVLGKILRAEEGEDSQGRDSTQTGCVEVQDLEEAWLIWEIAGGCGELGHKAQGWKVISHDVGKRGCCQL